MLTRTEADKLERMSNRYDNDYHRMKELQAAIRDVLEFGGKDLLGVREIAMLRRRLATLKGQATVARVERDKLDRKIMAEYN
jgi:hypothetical protein